MVCGGGGRPEGTRLGLLDFKERDRENKKKKKGREVERGESDLWPSLGCLSTSPILQFSPSSSLSFQFSPSLLPKYPCAQELYSKLPVVPFYF